MSLRAESGQVKSGFSEDQQETLEYVAEKYDGAISEAAKMLLQSEESNE